MFNPFKPKPEQIERKQIKEERNFVRESQMLDSASKDDQSYIVSQESKTDLLRWQQDLDDELFNLIQQLLGYQKVKEGFIEFSGAMCNKKFITEVIIPQCKPFMTRSLINSNWDEKMILNRLKITSNVVADSMSDNWDAYSIEFTNFDAVLNEVKTTIIAGAYRALNGWTKRIDSTMIKRIESMSEQMQEPQQKKGLLGVFKGG